MKKNRILSLFLALAMLLVCLPIQIHAEEQAASLIPKKFEQLETITELEEGVITFTEPGELASLCAQAQADLAKEYLCVYIGGSELHIAQNLTIPENMLVAVYSNLSTNYIYIEPGATVELQGYMEATYFINKGTFRISSTGMLYTPSKTDTEAGVIYNGGTIVSEGGYSSGVVGAKNIHNEGLGMVQLYGYFYNQTDLVKVCEQAAERNDGHWLYYFTVGYSGEPYNAMKLTVPSNCSLSLEVALTMDNVDMDVYGYIDCSEIIKLSGNVRVHPGGVIAIGAGFVLNGVLENYGDIAIVAGVDDFRGSLMLSDPQNYKDVKDGKQGRMIVMSAAGAEYPVYALAGMNVNNFSVEWFQEDGNSYWILTNYRGEGGIPSDATLLDSGNCGTSNVDGARWELYSDGTLKIFGGKSMDAIKADQNPWENYMYIIKRIEISDVETIAGAAFAKLPEVTSVSIGNSVTKIEGSAFAGCTKLASVTIPAGVKAMGASAFANCEGLGTVFFEEGSVLEVIPESAFENSGVKTIALPDSVTVIKKDAFKNCSKLESVQWPENLQEIDFGAFENCTSLTGHLYLSKSVKEVKSTTFRNIKGFETAEIYTVVQYIKFNQENLRSVKYGGDVIFLMSHEGAAKLEEVIIDVPIQTLYHSTFKDCVSLKTITLPESLTEMGNYCFENSGLTSIRLPSQLTEVPNGAFRDCVNLETVTWGENLTRIGTSAFWGCSSLKQIDLEGIIWIDSWAFNGCTAFTHVDLPESVEFLGTEAFGGCTGLEKVTIGAGGVDFQSAVFDKCTNLKEIKFLGDAPIFYYYITANFENLTLTIYYPEGNDTWTEEIMLDYGGDITWVSYHRYHDFTTEQMEADCLNPNRTVRTCTICGEVEIERGEVPPQGHNYGVDDDGNPDFWDTTCDVCGAERVVDKHRPTHSMYRMYNPNSGEHFYTGSMTERQNLEAAGWKYEGVGFTFPATTGKPVYRLYDKFGTMEHLYTMDEAEKDQLLAEGWILEGVAFNSGREDEVPQYRLHNPNATIGAYHFTASVEEKDSLIAAGWEYQGIGFYTCLQ